MIRLNKNLLSGLVLEKNIETINFDKNNLRNFNISKKANDTQIKNLIDYYGLPY